MTQSWLHVNMPCKILTRSHTALKRLLEIENELFCDGIEPLEYQCGDCGTKWGDAVLTDYREVTCSNCYSERVWLIAVRLTFHNWGEQNGGRNEQLGRYNRALEHGGVGPETAPATADKTPVEAKEKGQSGGNE